jgi:hypothetical protein
MVGFKARRLLLTFLLAASPRRERTAPCMSRPRVAREPEPCLHHFTNSKAPVK